MRSSGWGAVAVGIVTWMGLVGTPGALAREPKPLPVVEAELTYAPEVPPPITRKKPAVVRVHLYHCAAPPVMDHIANGMYGLILVEPKGGLPEVEREFYVLQSEFYTKEPARSVQTTLVPAGGATLVEFGLEVPGTYTLVDHAIFRVEKGAVSEDALRAVEECLRVLLPLVPHALEMVEGTLHGSDAPVVAGP